jgi:hypothetical protein
MVGFTPPPCDAGIIRATPAVAVALSQRRKRLTLAATILGSSMAFIDGSVVNIALPAIQQALHADAASTQWIVNGYLLLLGSGPLVWKRRTDALDVLTWLSFESRVSSMVWRHRCIRLRICNSNAPSANTSAGARFPSRTGRRRRHGGGARRSNCAACASRCEKPGLRALDCRRAHPMPRVRRCSSVHSPTRHR